MLFVTAIFLTGCSHADENYKPYIATRLAKVIMGGEMTVPDNEPNKLCDGSGWITHGDGHKTRCPGCEACNGGNGRVNIGASNDQVEKQPIIEKAEFIVYHFGAEWCAPCKQMKRETWGDKTLRKFMKDKGVKLSLLDYDTPKDKKYFEYYKARSLPTIVFVDKDSLEERSRVVGFVSSQRMLSLIREELNE